VIEQFHEVRTYNVRDIVAVELREGQEVNVEVGGIAVIVTRLFKINAVGSYVHRQLLDEDLFA
jgi:hypothetical protein